MHPGPAAAASLSQYNIDSIFKTAGEIRAQLYIAYELKYITESDFKNLHGKIALISRQLSGFINYIKTSEYKGSKYQTTQ